VRAYPTREVSTETVKAPSTQHACCTSQMHTHVSDSHRSHQRNSTQIRGHSAHEARSGLQGRGFVCGRWLSWGA
jgi:hypothetical protein